ncbi:MAG TPA: putative metal-binding motif-containing protein, partial [Myxococcota bacterium]|nr:putative metal-binding motif-containing protein [Myxococcota bacterium]
MRTWLILALMVAGADARASVCSTFVANNQVATLACDGTGWNTEIWATDAAQLNGYNSCAGGPFNERGPEWIFPFDCPGDVSVTVTAGGTDCDVDLFVLASGCNDVAGCVAASVRTGAGTGVQDDVTFDCTAGTTRYIVLEGFDLSVNPGRCAWDSPQHNYRLTNVSVIAFCDEICGDGADNDGDGRADCADADCHCQEDCGTVGDEDGDLAADCADFDCLGAPECCDEDGDGYAARVPFACGGDDCDDGDDRLHPGAAEVVANGRDEDCDGGDMCYRDADHDGYGTTATVPSADLWCGNAAGESQYSNDCLDSGPNAANVRPGALEVPGDGIDQDCDRVDACWQDLDNDGYGVGTAVDGPGLDCVAAAGWAAVNGDCLDQGPGAPSANPGEAEVCDGLDNDCDGLTDTQDPDLPANGSAWRDQDGDGYGAGAAVQVGACGSM